MSDDWLFARMNREHAFCRLHYFSLTVPHGDLEVEFVITVREHGPSTNESRRFVARADKQTNQRTVAYTPIGWGGNLLDALSRCVREIYRFPYEGDETRPAGALEIDEDAIPPE